MAIGTTTNGDGIDTPFDGIIDEFVVYNRTLSPEQIKELYRGHVMLD